MLFIKIKITLLYRMDSFNHSLRNPRAFKKQLYKYYKDYIHIVRDGCTLKHVVDGGHNKQGV